MSFRASPSSPAYFTCLVGTNGILVIKAKARGYLWCLTAKAFRI